MSRENSDTIPNPITPIYIPRTRPYKAVQLTREFMEDVEQENCPEWFKKIETRGHTKDNGISLFTPITGPYYALLGTVRGTLSIREDEWILQDEKGDLSYCPADEFNKRYAESGIPF